MFYDDDYDSYYGAMAFWYLFYLFLVLTPIIPAGDVGVNIAKHLTEGEMMMFVLLLSWILPALLYWFVLLYIWDILSKYLPTFIIIILGYFQGVVLAFYLKSLGYSLVSNLITSFVTKVFSFLTFTV